MLCQFRRQIYLSPIPGAGLFAVMLRVKTRKKFLSLCWHEYNCIKTDTHRHRHFMGNVWPRCPRTCGQQAFWVLHPPHHSLPFPRPPQMGMFYVQPRPSRQGCVVTVPHAATRVICTVFTSAQWCLWWTVCSVGAPRSCAWTSGARVMCPTGL